MPLVMSEAKSTFSFHVKAMSLLARSSSRQPPFTYCEQKEKASGCVAAHRLCCSFPGAEPSLANPGAPPSGWGLGMPLHVGAPVCGTVQILGSAPLQGRLYKPATVLTHRQRTRGKMHGSGSVNASSATDSVGTRGDLLGSSPGFSIRPRNHSRATLEVPASFHLLSFLLLSSIPGSSSPHQLTHSGPLVVPSQPETLLGYPA